MMMTMTSLDALQWNWGQVYAITGAAGHWLAQRRDNGHTLTACGPDELREMIVEDYADQQSVAHDAACGGTGR
jgi:hypothetical protein